MCVDVRARECARACAYCVNVSRSCVGVRASALVLVRVRVCAFVYVRVRSCTSVYVRVRVRSPAPTPARRGARTVLRRIAVDDHTKLLRKQPLPLIQLHRVANVGFTFAETLAPRACLLL